MTSCNGCGQCCDPVVLPNTQIEFVRAKGLDPITRRWVTQDLSPMPAKEAKQKAAWAFEARIHALGGIDRAMPLFYRCKWFDAEQRRCTNYENRPPPCSGFPWGLSPPKPNTVLPPMCSFNEDIGKPVQPMPPEWQKVILTRKR